MKTIQEAAKKHLIEKHQLFTRSAKSFIAGVEFAQRWIPIDEELPPVYVNVLIKTDKGVELSDRRTYQDGSIKWYLIESTRKVTHWRPIELM